MFVVKADVSRPSASPPGMAGVGGKTGIHLVFEERRKSAKTAATLREQLGRNAGRTKFSEQRFTLYSGGPFPR